MSSGTDVANQDAPTLSLSELMARGSVTQMALPDLLADADFIVGRSLADKESLLGTPLAITSITYRLVTEGGTKAEPRDYVSLEFVVISDDPNRCVEGVFNDGSTGVRRQVTQWLQSKGVLPDGDPDRAIATVKGDDVTYSREGGAFKALVAPRGLRRSDYIADATGEAATTYYLA